MLGHLVNFLSECTFGKKNYSDSENSDDSVESPLLYHVREVSSLFTRWCETNASIVEMIREISVCVMHYRLHVEFIFSFTSHNISQP